jgi:two-component system response regulator PilR (NtrC family)
MQVKLLRVIQEKSVRPIGESAEQPIDVRVLSATHKNLSALVATGRFREDLYYRINVIELHVPALREHAADIPELAAAILRRLGRRMGGEPPVLGADALAALEGYAFPGNVRELENILERALTLCAGHHIGSADLQLRVPVSAATQAVPPALSPPQVAVGSDLSGQLEHIERDAILKALEQTRYNKTAAARLLGMTFRALRYKVKKLGIE